MTGRPVLHDSFQFQPERNLAIELFWTPPGSENGAGEVSVSPVPRFSVTVEPLEDVCLIRAGGELDRSTADRLGSALDAARADGVAALLDLSAVSFIDSGGLRVLLRSAYAADADDWALFIVGASSAVRRLIELTGTGSELPLVAPPGSERVAPPEAAPQRLAG